MNRIRMGIQSGSKNMLDFYKRPTPPEKILNAGKVIASFAPKYHIPAAYDIIMDNPIETRDDVKSTLQLLYLMDRPYTLFIYSLKVIPNTGLAAASSPFVLCMDADSRLARDTLPPPAALAPDCPRPDQLRSRFAHAGHVGSRWSRTFMFFTDCGHEGKL